MVFHFDTRGIWKSFGEAHPEAVKFLRWPRKTILAYQSEPIGADRPNRKSGNAKDKHMKLLKNGCSSIAILAATWFGGGCANTGGHGNALSPAFYQLGTAEAVSIGLRNSPQTANWLRVVQPVVCKTVTGTALTPTDISAVVEKINAGGASNDAKAIVNGVLLLYIAAWNEIGAPTNSAVSRPYAQAIFCDGFAQGLALSPGTALKAGKPNPQWPLLR